MHPLSALELLEVWERGLAQRPMQRALTLLALARPETPVENLAKFSIGQRNTSLLKLREQIFGSQLASVAKCGRCNEPLEMTFTVADILLAGCGEPAETFSARCGDYEAQFRLPNSEDLLAIMYGHDSAVMRQLLFERCVLQVHHKSEAIVVNQLPAEVMQAVAEQMSQADPQADIQLTLACPLCGHQSQVRFDIVSFLWNELNAWACRLLQQVHSLARAYGWRESEILAMNPWRRQLYLEMIRT
jgi:hypothetical protein